MELGEQLQVKATVIPPKESSILPPVRDFTRLFSKILATEDITS
jgi:hypothetical protein